MSIQYHLNQIFKFHRLHKESSNEQKKFESLKNDRN